MSGSSPNWRPSARIETLRERAIVLAAVRSFFAARGVLEVETPTVVNHPVSDPQLANVRCQLAVRPGTAFFLHTSPEYHMKRLLAAGAPDIYQVCKVFRDGELGGRHLTEFTLVEWYRQRFTMDEMIAETCELVAIAGQHVGSELLTPVRLSYRDLFLKYAGLDPLAATVDEIRTRLGSLDRAGAWQTLAFRPGNDRTGCLDLVMVEVIEPCLRDLGLVVIERYPAEQAALARVDPSDQRVAERFEVYLHGIELANGYRELTDANEQRRRCQYDREQRQRLGLADTPNDEAFLAAVDAGLPECSGVALGFDRMLMACLGLGSISEVVSFPVPDDR